MKKINEIKFNDSYPKLWNQTTAQLIMGDEAYGLDIKNSRLYEYDCKKSDGTYYDLENEEKYLILYFIGDQGIPFCTLRKNNEENKKKYGDHIGEYFKITID